jgi:SAM-dependent methyltransferase
MAHRDGISDETFGACKHSNMTLACAVADEYPNTEFLGLDLSPIQPELVPENVHFVVDDIEHENGWDYPENKFDFIHVRHTLHSIKDRQQLFERALR